MALVIGAGCGPVALVDPDADLRASLVIGGAQRVVVAGDPSVYLLVTGRVRSVPVAHHFELDGPSGRSVVPDAAVEAVSCQSDTQLCWVIALPPLPEPPGEVVLVVPSLEHESRASLPILAVPPTTVTALITGGGQGLEVGVDDPVAAAADRLLMPWVRRFDMIATPGPCAEPVADDDPRWIRGAPARQVIVEPLPAGPDRALCLEVRPDRPRGAPPAFRRSVGPTAQIETFDQDYAPPVEVAPLVWMLISDLHLPSETACARNESRLERAVADAAQAIAAQEDASLGVYALSPLRLADADGRPCQQATDRRLDVDDLIQRIDDEVDAVVGPEARVRVLLVYANNLDIEPSQALVEDFDALVRRAELRERRPFGLISVSPPRGALGPALATVELAAATEPAFAASMRAALSTVWPFRTTVHRDDTRVPLVDADRREQYVLYRVVSSAPEVQPIGTPVADVLAPDADGPAYRVALPPAVLQPAARFLRPRVTVRWEGCLADCSQPRAGQAPPSAWTLDR